MPQLIRPCSEGCSGVCNWPKKRVTSQGRKSTLRSIFREKGGTFMYANGTDSKSIYFWLSDKIGKYLRGEFDVDYDTLRGELRRALHDGYIGYTAYAALSYQLQRKVG